MSSPTPQLTFHLTDAPIEPATLQKGLHATHAAGACVTFEGWVRDLNEGRAVTALEYEAHTALAEKEGARILAETAAKFPLLAATCEHRLGTMAPGDMAIWVGVTSAHRATAFDACRHIIDEVKSRVPIWKKEHYAAHPEAPRWLNAAP